MGSQQAPGATPSLPALEDLSKQELLEFLRERLQAKPEASPDLSKNFQTFTAAFSLLGLGLYGAVRFGQQLFYNRLRLTPEEVGLSYTAAVSRAAVVIAALLMTLILIASSIWALGYLPATRPRSGLLIAGLIALPTAGAAVFISVITLGDVGFLIGPGIVFVAIAIVIAVAKAGDRPLTLKGLRDRPALILSTISMITILAFVLSGATALRSASVVKNGKELFGEGAYGILGLRSEQVKLSGQLPAGFTAPQDIIYLGRSDGMIILYDYSKDQPIRIPADGLAVLHR